MKFIELTFDDPAANLACDEALLELLEARSASDECLRVWEARNHFVVLGHSNPLQSNVNVADCLERDIPILRRTSGGGTVVQGPGCLNYSLILRNDAHRLNNIAATFRYVLERHRAMVEKTCGLRVRFEGSSDLTTAGQKFSGNAQYRKARSVLVHGTFLLNFDLAMIEALLPIPAKQPDYRHDRPHLQFVTNLQVDPAQLRDKLKAGWGCARDVAEVPFDRIAQLIRDRYGNSEWVEKF
jgi:lipoate---protein ligase